MKTKLVGIAVELKTGTIIKVGNQYRTLNGILYHVRAIVDGMIAARHWSRRKQCWIYTIEDPCLWGLFDRAGRLEYRGHNKGDDK